MIEELTRVANSLDSKGHSKEADALDEIINKLAAGGFRPPPDFPGAGLDSDVGAENGSNQVGAVDFFEAADTDDSGAIDREEMELTLEAVRMTIRAFSPEASDEEIDAELKKQLMPEEDVDLDELEEPGPVSSKPTPLEDFDF